MKRRFELENKIILVTGAATGIGRITAQMMARVGAKVAIVDANYEDGIGTYELIKKESNEASFFKGDVSKKSDVRDFIQEIIRKYGRIDGAFNNAGMEGMTAPTTDCSEENWESTIQVNLKGVFLCMKYELLEMLKQGHGSIVNTSSLAGLVGVENRPAYVASKHGVIGLTKAAAIEYSNRNIRINAICPGVIRTPLIDRLISEDPDFETVRISRHPIGRLGTPEEVAEAAIWLLSDSASFITGAAIAVDGGYTAK